MAKIAPACRMIYKFMSENYLTTLIIIETDGRFVHETKCRVGQDCSVEKYFKQKLLQSIMSTSIKISEKAKRVLDMIQAKITLATGRKYSQQELLDMIIESSDEDKEEMIRRLTKFQHLSEKEIDSLNKLSVDWKIRTKEEEIDLYLYGSKKERK